MNAQLLTTLIGLSPTKRDELMLILLFGEALRETQAHHFISFGEWDHVAAALRRCREEHERPTALIYPALMKHGFQGRNSGERITPPIPLSGVRMVLSWYERGTASAMAWNWLAYGDEIIEETVAAIKEWHPCGYCAVKVPHLYCSEKTSEPMAGDW